MCNNHLNNPQVMRKTKAFILRLEEQEGGKNWVPEDFQSNPICPRPPIIHPNALISPFHLSHQLLDFQLLTAKLMAKLYIRKNT